ncbi:MAG: hypothetical protein JZU49_03345 [Sulfuricurvum sp.]|nr:hypothetical protein [Sulfuricurvum sp.]
MKKYLFIRESDGAKIFGDTNASQNTGGYRIEPSNDRARVTVYDRLNRDSVDTLDLPVSAFLKENDEPYETFAELDSAFAAFFFRVGGVSSSDTELATDTFYTETEIDALLKRDALSGYQFFNPDIKILPLGLGDVMASPYTIVDGTLFLVACVVYKPTTINKFCWVLQTQGAFTGDNENKLAIYSVSGTTYTKVAETASDENIWKTAATALGSKSLAAPVTLQPGAYFIAGLWNAASTTTAPALYQLGSISVSSQRLFGTTGHRLCSTLAAQTTMPATVANGTTSAGGVIPGIWVE